MSNSPIPEPFVIDKPWFRHCRAAGRSESGFTLLEVMIAVAVIAIAVVSLMGSQSQSVSNATVSRFNVTASLLARQKLTELEIGDFDALSSDEGQFDEPHGNYSWRIETQTPTDDETGITGSGDLLRIVDIYITLGGDERLSYSARSIVMRRIQPDKS